MLNADWTRAGCLALLCVGLSAGALRAQGPSPLPVLDCEAPSAGFVSTDEGGVSAYLTGPGPWRLTRSLPLSDHRGRVLRLSCEASLAPLSSSLRGVASAALHLRVSRGESEVGFDGQGRDYVLPYAGGPAGGAVRPTLEAGIDDDAVTAEVSLVVRRWADAESEDPADRAPLQLRLRTDEPTAIGVVGETHHEAVRHLPAHLLAQEGLALFARPLSLQIEEEGDPETIEVKVGVLLPEGGARATDAIVWHLGPRADAWEAWRQAEPLRMATADGFFPRVIHAWVDWQRAASEARDLDVSGPMLARAATAQLFSGVEPLLGGVRDPSARFLMAAGRASAWPRRLGPEQRAAFGAIFCLTPPQASDTMSGRVAQTEADSNLITITAFGAQLRFDYGWEAMGTLFSRRLPEHASEPALNDLGAALAAALAEAEEETAGAKRVAQEDHAGTCSTCGHAHGPGEHHHHGPAPAPSEPANPVAPTTGGGKR